MDVGEAKSGLGGGARGEERLGKRLAGGQGTSEAAAGWVLWRQTSPRVKARAGAEGRQEAGAGLPSERRGLEEVGR